MFKRLTLPALAALCVIMNVFVWRAEYGSREAGLRVPESLVWRKIMTAPEASSLNVFQGGKRTGFCEFSTSVGQEMAQLDETKPPPEGFINHAGYQIHINGNATRACITPISSVAGKTVTTIEGLSADTTHPVQTAWIEEDVPQCGYCQSGQLMAAASLLAKTPKPTDADIDEALHGNICRCGTYSQIRRAIHRAAEIKSATAGKAGRA